MQIPSFSIYKMSPYVGCPPPFLSQNSEISILNTGLCQQHKGHRRCCPPPHPLSPGVPLGRFAALMALGWAGPPSSAATGDCVLLGQPEAWASHVDGDRASAGLSSRDDRGLSVRLGGGDSHGVSAGLGSEASLEVRQAQQQR